MVQTRSYGKSKVDAGATPQGDVHREGALPLRSSEHDLGDQYNSQVVAIKLQRDFKDHEIRELEMIKSLRHSHVMRVHDFEKVSGSEAKLTLSQPSLLGDQTCDLATVLQSMYCLPPRKKNAPYDPKSPIEEHFLRPLTRLKLSDGGSRPCGVVEDLYRQLCMRSIRHISKAIEYLHSKNIGHRNLSPGAILLGPDNKLWVTDFWISDWRMDPAQPPETGQSTGDDIFRRAFRYSVPGDVAKMLPKDWLPANIYSLGGMFFDMAALCNGITTKRKATHLKDAIDVREIIKRSFYEDRQKVTRWLKIKSIETHCPMDCQIMFAEIRRMLRECPDSRPPASEVVRTVSAFFSPASRPCDIYSETRAILEYGFRYAPPRSKESTVHYWSIHVECNDTNFRIREVVFYLHPSWDEPIEVRSRPPYVVFTSGFGKISVRAAVYLDFGRSAHWRTTHNRQAEYRACSEPICFDMDLETDKRKKRWQQEGVELGPEQTDYEYKDTRPFKQEQIVVQFRSSE